MAIRTANNQSLTEITAFPSAVALGGLVLIKELTASSSGTLDFVNGASDVVLDSTYKEYIFKFISCHPSNDSVDFAVNFSVDTGSNYNVTKTTSFIASYNNEAGGSVVLTYADGNDLQAGTGVQMLVNAQGNGNDESCAGTLTLFNPSSTTFVKHFIATSHRYYAGDYAIQDHMAGYCDTTSAVDAVQFKMSAGTIDAGTIKLYGIKDS